MLNLLKEMCNFAVKLIDYKKKFQHFMPKECHAMKCMRSFNRTSPTGACRGRGVRWSRAGARAATRRRAWPAAVASAPRPGRAPPLRARGPTRPRRPHTGTPTTAPTRPSTPATPSRTPRRTPKSAASP